MGVAAERTAFERHPRTGRRRLPHPIERKLYHNHDPRDGRFTFTGLGGMAGPFRTFAGRKDKVGEAARALNRVVTDPRAKETLPLFGSDVTIERTGGNGVKLTGRGGDIVATGTFAALPGKPAVDIAIRNYALSGKIVRLSIASFPSTVRIYATTVGSLVSKIDRPVVIKAGLIKIVDKPAGPYELAR